jgi:uncharacterized SAM-binding protein YcdF (DUF218 family)
MIWLKHLLSLTLVLVLSVFTSALLLIVETWNTSEDIEHPTLFAAVILGDESEFKGGTVSDKLAARLDKAVELYTDEKAYFFILSSGRSNWNDEPIEANAMKSYLEEQGIPEKRLILESQSAATTIENIHYSKLILDSLECDAVYIITSKPHLCRALLIARHSGIESVGIASETTQGTVELFVESMSEAAQLLYYFAVEQWDIPDMNPEDYEPDYNVRYSLREVNSYD